MTPEGILVFERPSFGFTLVVEGAPGVFSAPVGATTFSQNNGILPDLQVVVSMDLGNGNTAVCDTRPEARDGVPAAGEISPAQAPAINDLGCRFKNAFGQPGGRGPNEACTRLPDESFGFWEDASTIQFCGFIDRPFEFHTGDTLVRVRIRDVLGNLSDEAQIIIRVR